MSIEFNIKKIQNQIADLQAHSSIAAKNVTLLAVSKMQTVESIRQAYDAGLRDFGENYVQEAQTKMRQLSDLAICWHMIGDVQSNKARIVAEQFAWVHTVSRLKIAERLNRFRPTTLPPLNICIEVNVDNEANKSGIAIEDVLPFAKELLTFPQLKLRGLMCIPASESANAAFLKLAQCQQELISAGIDVDTLSMGMSADYLDAIKQGATIVRVGSGIFGARKIIPINNEDMNF